MREKNARDDMPDEQSNPDVDFLLGTIWMTGSRFTAKPKGRQPAKVITTKELMVAETIKSAIEKTWKKSITQLAERSGISQASIHKLKREGADSKTPALRALCDCLGIDDDAVMRGEILHIKQLSPVDESTDIVDLAKKVRGTADEDLARQFLLRLGKN